MNLHRQCHEEPTVVCQVLCVLFLDPEFYDINQIFNSVLITSPRLVRRLKPTKVAMEFVTKYGHKFYTRQKGVFFINEMIGYIGLTKGDIIFVFPKYYGVS